MVTSATVRYDSDHNRTSISVDARGKVGITGKFSVKGYTAVLTSVESRSAGDEIYADDISYIMDYVEDLPFVQAVTMDDYEPEERD